MFESLIGLNFIYFIKKSLIIGLNLIFIIQAEKLKLNSTIGARTFYY